MSRNISKNQGYYFLSDDHGEIIVRISIDDEKITFHQENPFNVFEKYRLSNTLIGEIAKIDFSQVLTDTFKEAVNKFYENDETMLPTNVEYHAINSGTYVIRELKNAIKAILNDD